MSAQALNPARLHLHRLTPPSALTDPLEPEVQFRPAPDVEEWLRQVFIEPGGPLFREEHQHLQQATLGVLWTNAVNVRQGNRVAGTAEIPKPTSGSRWQKERLQFQLREWLGEVPDFLITLDASLCAEATDLAFCALAKHELLHCAQAVNEFGMPRFRKDDGRPIWAIRGHDVEEFVSVVREFGPHGLLNPQVRELVEVASRNPARGAREVGLACGTCLR